MKKRQPTLKQLMLSGIAGGLLLTQLAVAADKSDSPKKKTLMDLAAATDGNISYHLMSEEELLLQLNDEGTKIYNTLSPEGKELARSVASRSCNGTNECKGLNACASDKNKCLGQGECKGQTKCSISDKNLAVKLVAKKMQEKRLDAQNQGANNTKK